jgi:hypothetical protein
VVDLQNMVEYQQDDASIPSKLATNPNVTQSGGFTNFGAVTLIGDRTTRGNYREAVDGPPLFRLSLTIEAAAI